MVIIFALLAPVLLGAVGLAVDYATWTMQRATLQRAADAAALAVASDMQVSGTNTQRMQSLADAYVKSNVKLQRGDGEVHVTVAPVARERPGGPFVPAGQVAGRGPTAVTIMLTQRKYAIMSRLVTPQLTDNSVSATAEAVGTTRLCVVALDPSDDRSMRLAGDSEIDARGCAVYALSANAKAIVSSSGTLLAAATTCTVGGYTGHPSSFKPLPVTGCRVIKDPLADRPAPDAGPCRETNLRLRRGSHTLYPGTYCGGILVDVGATVVMAPGIYVIKDGSLVVGPPEQIFVTYEMCDQPTGATTLPQCKAEVRIENIGSLKGDGVGIYFTGDPQKGLSSISRPMLFLPASVVELTAPRTGPMAGMLLFEDRQSPAGRVFDILSDSARRLVGTIYLPRGTFSVRANQVVADQSEYTAIVANKIYLNRRPRLTLNTRYSDTDVPVPNGLGPTSSAVGLAK
ncbi:TadE/TadG family type IV pilus assembly protein [Methylobacterium terrae]|uniref:TadE/TadG family type IV pilus assembly protein n=1 Tax=Methylobacterium terrae TaxID=2202827 RepID=UPI001FDF1633|nr:pilus assembly protein TadG-related protein [Methylobacterium terrae]